MPNLKFVSLTFSQCPKIGGGYVIIPFFQKNCKGACLTVPEKIHVSFEVRSFNHFGAIAICPLHTGRHRPTDTHAR